MAPNIFDPPLIQKTRSPFRVVRSKYHLIFFLCQWILFGWAGDVYPLPFPQLALFSPFSSIRIVVRSVRSMCRSTFSPPVGGVLLSPPVFTLIFVRTVRSNYRTSTFASTSITFIILLSVPYMGYTHVPRLPLSLLTPKGMPYRSWVPWIVRGGQWSPSPKIPRSAACGRYLLTSSTPCRRPVVREFDDRGPCPAVE